MSSQTKVTDVQFRKLFFEKNEVHWRKIIQEEDFVLKESISFRLKS